MRIIGLDLGSKTVGVALADPLKIFASPYKTIRFEEDNYEEALEQVSLIVKELNVSEIVLGLPKHMNGDVGIRGEISIEFKEMLENELSVKVVLWDERLSTAQAQRNLIKADVKRKKRKEVIDKMAAVVILQSYLDR